LEKAF